MIKFTANGPHGEIIIGLGLEPGNLERLMQDQPIHVKLRELGFQGLVGRVDIVIFAGTLEQMEAGMKEHIGPQTVIHKSDKLG